MERVLVRMHIERVDREIVGRQVERLEHLSQRQVLAVSENDDLLQKSEGRRRRECDASLCMQSVGARTSGHRFILLLMNRSMCFWFMLAE